MVIEIASVDMVMIEDNKVDNNSLALYDLPL